MSSPKTSRIAIVVFVLILVPILPQWIAEFGTGAFDWDPHKADIAAEAFSGLLFVGAVSIGIGLYRRVTDSHEDEE